MSPTAIRHCRGLQVTVYPGVQCREEVYPGWLQWVGAGRVLYRYYPPTHPTAGLTLIY